MADDHVPMAQPLTSPNPLSATMHEGGLLQPSTEIIKETMNCGYCGRPVETEISTGPNGRLIYHFSPHEGCRFATVPLTS